MKSWIIFFLLVATTGPVRGNWFDSEDMQLFDLVEEVNGTFYEFMNLNQSATVAEVRKAFRVLSLKLHPDKSDDPDADSKFRQLVSISEVLKDESKRVKYDNILENGLPDWKTGMYYIRRARKLGLLELGILLSLILTIGHYLCLVAAYYEKVFEVKSMIKKKEKKLKKEEYEEFLQQVMDTNNISKPQLSQDNLPRKTMQLMFRLLFVHIPVAAITITDLAKTRFNSSKNEDAGEAEETVARVKKVRVKQALPDLSGQKEDEDEGSDGNGERSFNHEPASAFNQNDWSQEEVLLLIKMTKKFPGGTSQRWERIACAIGRSVDDVTKMSKSLKTGQVKITESLVSSKQQPVSQANDSVITSRDVEASDGVQNWSQFEQKLLEDALQAFPRGVEDRWDQIAQFIGKPKDDCIKRFKWLAELVKRKKTLASDAENQ